MGCSASKLDHEDTVRRCKDRRRLMKEAVFSRHHLAAAHSDYCRSLRVTGAALTDFASDEPLSVSDSTPAVLLPKDPSSFANHKPPPPPPSVSRSRSATAAPFSPAPSTIRPPPPPPPYSPSVASAKLPQIHTSNGRSQRRKSLLPNLPHILSDSNPSTPATAKSAGKFDYQATYTAYASTPSQASSVWNWENFYPPSPPDSEFFNHRNDAVYSPKKTGKVDYERHHLKEGYESHDQKEGYERHHLKEDYERHCLKEGYEGHDQKEGYESHHLKEGYESHHLKEGYESHHLEADESEEEEREEVECSEWGDHCSSTSSESEHGGGEEEEEYGESRSMASEIRSRSEFGASVVHGSSIGGRSRRYKGSEMGKVEEDEVFDNDSVRWGNEADEMRMVVRHRDLKEIVASIREYFDMAASAGDQVSEMLETGRAQLDRNFRQLKKTVYHSSGVLSNLSSSWTSKPPLAVKYKLDASVLNEPGGPKSLCSTLERLLAWEKKLYEEVKAREGVKIEHEKKLKTLQNQEYKGGEQIKLDKTRASITRLHSLIIVTSQAVDTTSSAITGLRESDLIPQLVELCHGLMYMWRSMNQSHEFQNQIVQQVRGLVHQAAKGGSTSEIHRQATRDLESAVSAWHSSFCRLVKYQRDFICSIHGWFKQSLLPVDSEAVQVTTPPSEAFLFFDEWKHALERLPDAVASEAIKSFVNVVHVISTQQSEEIKVKRKAENVSKELEKKSSSLRNIEKKYYHSYSMVGLGLPDNGPDRGQILDARDPLSEKKAELAACQRRVEDEMSKHSKAVEVTRAMTLNNIQTGLPGVFQAMTSFSSLFSSTLDTVCTRSYSIK